MSGRGQYWKKGGLVDETVKEEDLSQALQTKVNTGGGGSGVFELIKTITLGSDLATAQITLDTPINFTDYSEIQLIVTGLVVTGTARIGVRLNNSAFNSQYAWSGSIVGGGVSAFAEHPSNPFWELDSTLLLQDSIFYLKIVLAGGSNLEPDFRKGTGEQTWNNVSNQLISSVGGLSVNGFGAGGAINTVISFEVDGQGVGNIGTGSILSVFGKKIV